MPTISPLRKTTSPALLLCLRHPQTCFTGRITQSIISCSLFSPCPEQINKDTSGLGKLKTLLAKVQYEWDKDWTQLSLFKKTAVYTERDLMKIVENIQTYIQVFGLGFSQILRRSDAAQTLISYRKFVPRVNWEKNTFCFYLCLSHPVPEHRFVICIGLKNFDRGVGSIQLLPLLLNNGAFFYLVGCIFFHEKLNFAGV